MCPLYSAALALTEGSVFFGVTFSGITSAGLVSALAAGVVVESFGCGKVSVTAGVAAELSGVASDVVGAGAGAGAGTLPLFFCAS